MIQKIEWTSLIKRFLRGQFRNLADYSAVLQAVVDDKEYRRSLGLGAKGGIGRVHYEMTPRTELTTVGKKGDSMEGVVSKVSTPETVEAVQSKMVNKYPDRTESFNAVGRGVVWPSGEARGNVVDIIRAAQTIGRGEDVQQLMGDTPKQVVKYQNAVEELGRLQKDIVEMEYMMAEMDRLSSGSEWLNEVVAPEGVKVIESKWLTAKNEVGDMYDLSAIVPEEKVKECIS